MLDRRERTRLQMLNAAHIGRDDGLRFELRELIELAIAQLSREIRLQDRIRAGGAAAKMTFSSRDFDLESKRPQMRFDFAL